MYNRQEGHRKSERELLKQVGLAGLSTCRVDARQQAKSFTNLPSSLAKSLRFRVELNGASLSLCSFFEDQPYLGPLIIDRALSRPRYLRVERREDGWSRLKTMQCDLPMSCIVQPILGVIMRDVQGRRGLVSHGQHTHENLAGDDNPWDGAFVAPCPVDAAARGRPHPLENAIAGGGLRPIEAVGLPIRSRPP